MHSLTNEALSLVYGRLRQLRRAVPQTYVHVSLMMPKYIMKNKESIRCLEVRNIDLLSQFLMAINKLYLTCFKKQKT